MTKLFLSPNSTTIRFKIIDDYGLKESNVTNYLCYFFLLVLKPSSRFIYIGKTFK